MVAFDVIAEMERVKNASFEGKCVSCGKILTLKDTLLHYIGGEKQLPQDVKSKKRSRRMKGTISDIN